MPTKPVYLFDMDGKLIMKFETTAECAEYFNVEPEYINHNLKYCNRIRYQNYKWYIISRKENLNEECNGIRQGNT